MPTYDYRCPKCGAEESRTQTIREYSVLPDRPVCCMANMERKLSVVPGSALSNAVAGDRHYDGLRASDGTDISSRTKHRAYMKANDLTTADDFKGVWANAAKERQRIRTGEDPARKKEVREVVERAIQST